MAATAMPHPLRVTPLDTEQSEKIVPQQLVDEMKQSYLDYAMSVIVGRALPDARDGLKPVHRRVLYAMHEMGSGPRAAYKKSARIVGDVMGKYHPHGDQAIYDTMVRMAQEFSLRYPLVDGQGNFGSIDGDRAAAMRYTESRMASIALEVLTDLEQDTVDFNPNYDGSLKEPAVLPGRLPGLLVNGAAGIAVGMATNMPPHNLREVAAALLLVIDDPDVELPRLMEAVPGPDFPTGGLILGRGGIFNAYATGQGRLKVRGRVTVEGEPGAKQRLVFTEIPYNLEKNRLLETISELVRDKKLTGIADLRDESDRRGMRVVVELRRDAQPEVVENLLYKHTPLESTFAINNVALVNNRPRRLGLRELLDIYLDHRREVVTRRSRFQLRQARDRAHILEGLLIAHANLDAVIALVREAEGREAVLTGLQERFELSEVQAKAIADMRLYQLSRLDVKERRNELAELRTRIAELEAVLADPARVLALIRTELEELREKFGDERRTEIVEDEGELVMEDLIERHQVVVMRTRAGYLKRMRLDDYRAQHRGGKGRTGIRTRDDDIPDEIYTLSSHDYLLLFTSLGGMYWVKAWQVPEMGHQARGTPVVQLLTKLDERGHDIDERVLRMLPVANLQSSEHYLLFATRRGVVKKTRLDEYSSRIERSWKSDQGLRAITLKEGDRVVDVAISDGHSEIMLATADGRANRFAEGDVRHIGRYGQGVRGVRLEEGDTVVSMALLTADDLLLTVTERGFGKLAPAENYRLTRRGGKGVTNLKVDTKSGCVVAALPTRDANQLLATTRSGKVIRTGIETIRVINRVGRGVRVMRLDDDDAVVAVTLHTAEEENDTEADDGAATETGENSHG